MYNLRFAVMLVILVGGLLAADTWLFAIHWPTAAVFGLLAACAMLVEQHMMRKEYERMVSH